MTYKRDMPHQDCLIRGDEYLERFPDFALFGRDRELSSLQGILMRSRSNSALIVGSGGVGISALCMGLESTRDHPQTPLDIAAKRKFWLDTDTLFSPGDPATINATFRKLTASLARTPQSILIIDDMRDFIDACRGNGCTNLINSLMRDIKNHKYQAVIESRDEDLDSVIKCHSDMREIFTMMDLLEPEGENLYIIINESVKRLEKFHGIKIEREAVDVAIEVTCKYRVSDASLSRAQPERALTLLDRALAKYRQDAHAQSPELYSLSKEMEILDRAIAGDPPTSSNLTDKSEDELMALKQNLAKHLEQATSTWEETRRMIRALHKEQLDAEQLIREKEDQIAEQQQIEEKRNQSEAPESSENNDHTETDVVAKEDTIDVANFLESARVGGYESNIIRELRTEIKKYQAAAEESRKKYDQLLDGVNRQLLLTRDRVLQTFSSLSGIPANRLNQDERQKLKSLENDLLKKVFDQDHAVSSLANSVKAARVGLRDRNKPMGAFIFIGPSGVGKTELVKALTEVLFEDPKALMRLDMSEFQEKHAVAKLIGAPPGYEGFEAGGILTNGMRRNPQRIVLMDEIEKAHKDVFDICLQIVDDARLTDNLGRVCSFADSVVVLTSNIGSEYFIDKDIGYEEAVRLATEDLEKAFRPEFLNRFNGRRNIKFFKALSLGAINKIARREIDKTNSKLERNDLSIEMSDDDLQKMAKIIYRPKDGARGIVGFINDCMDAKLSNTILETPNAKGVMTVTFDEATKEMKISAPSMQQHDPAVQADES